MKAVIFDCDGVLVDSEALAEGVLEEYLGRWLPDLNIAERLGQALGMTTGDILKHLEQHSVYTLPDNATEQVDSTIEARLARELTPVAGAHDAVLAIPLAKAVVSNSRRQRVVASLACTQLADAFGKDTPIFTADQVANPKPDPALYLLAATQLGYLPGNCLVIEDSVAGVTAAHAAGMCVIGFVGASHVDAEQPARLLDAGAWRILEHMQGLNALVNEWQVRIAS
ncbi:Hydrolase in polyol utilization gene cluster, haloacid dehalogenase-like family [Halomonas citrativorans]|uniref:HAD-IA family hydrolase n=1 Tax=Halomonas citrativorans TaxID=2742612 RepID=A0A1R4I5J1_9GAMM|nr:HAD-IA family hydrolase [Halomonas citrativorans]MBE0404992.1 HAD-IA family hydrolase [Halomonas citrativorans]SJN15072.1 Hydrolase in polyol utilization gene cluster, haloacid dehalogenase-like family [Halomonas citrativorans]